MPTAIAYIRVSAKRQVTDGNSLAIQRQQAEAYASQKGYTLARIFEELGESAKTDDRTALKEMIDYCKKHSKMVDVLIFPKVDRLARDSHDYATIKVLMLRLGICFESIGENFDNTPAGRFSENVLVAVAQFDNEVRAERCRGGMVQCVKEGRWTWKPPIGYRTTRVNRKGTIEPDPTLAPLIEQFFRRMASGHETLRTSQEWFASQGVRVSYPNLHRVVRNKAYLGIIDAFGGEFRAVEPFVPLVDEGTFYRAQEAVTRRRNRTFYDRDNPDFPLRGTIRCGGCSSLLTACWSTGLTSRYAYYRCLTCRNTNLRRKDVEGDFVTYLNRFRFEPHILSVARERLLQAWADERRSDLEQIEKTVAKIEEHRQLQRSIAIKNASGIVPDSIAREEIERLNLEIGLLTPQQKEWPDTPADFEGLVDRAFSFLTHMGNLWEVGSTQYRKRFQKFFFPDGYIHDRETGFRTDENSLPERLRAFIADSIYSLVDSPEDSPKECQNVTEFLLKFENLEGEFDHGAIQIVPSEQERFSVGIDQLKRQ